MKKLITITFLICTTLLLHGQTETKVDRTKGFKIGLGYAESSHTFGHTYNIEITKPLINNWQVTGFFEKLQKRPNEKLHYSQLGLTIGKKHNVHWDWLEINWGFGLGYISKIDWENHSRYIRTIDYGFLGTYKIYEYWTTYHENKKLGVPVKIGLDIKVIDNIYIGLYKRKTFVTGRDISSTNYSITYQF